MADAQRYIVERLKPRLIWYDKRAVLSKRLHLTFQFVGMAGSILLVLLIHIESIKRPYLGALAALVSLCLAADKIGRFGELWLAYRLTAEALGTEEQMFHHQVGPYAAVDGKEEFLILRCEGILSREAEVWRGIVEERPGVVKPGEVVE
jgi:hypothetical protein